jgi:hypothetical protein
LVNTPREVEVSCFFLWLDMDDLLGGRRDRFPSYFAGNSYIQHNPWVADNLTGRCASPRLLPRGVRR